MLLDREILLAAAVILIPILVAALAVWIIVDQKRNPAKYAHLKDMPTTNLNEVSDQVLRRGHHGTRPR